MPVEPLENSTTAVRCGSSQLAGEINFINSALGRVIIRNFHQVAVHLERVILLVSSIKIIPGRTGRLSFSRSSLLVMMVSEVLL